MTSKTRLAQWIEDNDLTLGEVAELTGFSKSMIGLAARGERNFSAAGKVKVARRLGARVGVLFDVTAEDKVAV
ncbi:helix-turn-helix transcriptional regulator [Streptosporangium canum]|uniref:helix-turn-helix domain-containing protein n=1 Tax=Streptosporangium canum TaxID=324952 RepID=UPI0034231B49